METRKSDCTCPWCVRERMRKTKDPAPAWFTYTALVLFVFLGIANLW